MNARLFAASEGISLSHLISSALAEMLAAVGAEAYLQAHAERSTRAKFDAALAHVPVGHGVIVDEWHDTRPTRHLKEHVGGIVAG